MGQQEQRRQQNREAKAAENHAVAVALLLVPVLLLLVPLLPLMLLLLLLRRALCCPCSTKVAEASDDNNAESTDMYKQRVLRILLDKGDIGLGEVEQRTVSLTTMLRYAVLRSTQMLVSCCASAHSLFACLGSCLTCSMDDDDEMLPQGGTKYLFVEFNAWVYSGVRRGCI